MSARATHGAGVCILALFLVGAGVFRYAEKESMNPTPSPTPEGGYVVLLTKRGFEPSELVIPHGEMVTFKSEVGTFWPASDAHPYHDAYPAFDPGAPVASGTSWTFTFAEPGVWRFHDHLHSYFTGTVTVDSGGREGECSDPKSSTRAKRMCMEEYIDDVISREGLEAGFRFFEEWFEHDLFFRANCHNVTHRIGRAAYRYYAAGKLNSFTGREATYCSFGFYHGFIEELSVTTGDLTKVREFCTIFETKNADGISFLPACLHGVGHGITDLLASPVAHTPAEAVGESLEICETFWEDEFRRSSCASGVFNALALMYQKGTYTLKVDPEDPMKFCREQEKTYLTDACYKNFKALIYTLSEGNFVRASHFLEHITDEKIADGAMDNLTTYAAKDALDLNKDDALIQSCRLVARHLQGSCITGFAAGFLSFGPPNEEYRRAIRFCGLKGLSEKERTRCYDRILYVISLQYPHTKQNDICLMVPSAYQYLCIPVTP